jgi:hypothetical protein
MSRTNKFRTSYKTRTTKYRSNRLIGWNHFRTRPYGRIGWDYSYQRWYDEDRGWHLSEDLITIVNKKGYRQKLKKELKNIIDKECIY